MYSIKLESDFSTAHNLGGYSGIFQLYQRERHFLSPEQTHKSSAKGYLDSSVKLEIPPTRYKTA